MWKRVKILYILLSFFVSLSGKRWKFAINMLSKIVRRSCALSQPIVNENFGTLTILVVSSFFEKTSVSVVRIVLCKLHVYTTVKLKWRKTKDLYKLPGLDFSAPLAGGSICRKRFSDTVIALYTASFIESNSKYLYSFYNMLGKRNNFGERQLIIVIQNRKYL